MKKLKKIRVVQFEPKPRAPEENAANMIDIINAAKKDEIGLVVFPYNAVEANITASDFEPEPFVVDCNDAATSVIAASEGISVLFSSLVRDDEGNQAYWKIFAENGKLSAYGELLDSYTTLTSEYSGKFAVVSTLDYFDEEDTPELERGVKFLVVEATSHFTRDREEEHFGNLSKIAKKEKLPLAYANIVGVNNIGKIVRTYRGDSAVFDARGRCVELATPYTECSITFSPEECNRNCSKREIPPQNSSDIGTVAETLRYGMKKLMEQLGIKRVVIGVSGGIDSAVSTALYGSIMPPEDILLVSMPGPFTSGTTRNLGRDLAKNIGARFAELPIGESVELTKRQFADLITEGPHGAMAGAWSLTPFAVENVQARDRGTRLLAAAAAAFGGVVSCNANKDECTVGYGTLYGDISGWLCCLGDLWKGEVYAVGRYLNDKVYKREVIPEGIFKIKPSAELSEKQAVEKGLGDPLNYPYHDKLFRCWVEDGFTPYECLEWYMDGTLEEMIGYEGDVDKIFATPADFIADIERWWNLYRGLSVAKRIQAPPVMAIGSSPFGELDEPQGKPYYGRRYRELKEKILGSH